MKVLFTIWAKVGQKVVGAVSIYRYICTRKKLDEKNNPNYFCYVKIIVYLCGMKTKKNKRMNKELVTMLAIIATGATLSGLLLGSGVLAAIGMIMYLLPIYVGICGNKYF